MVIDNHGVSVGRTKWDKVTEGKVSGSISVRNARGFSYFGCEVMLYPMEDGMSETGSSTAV